MRAAASEAQHKTSAKHYVPADKCTPEIYKRLKDKDNAPPDPTTATALQAVKENETRLKNSESMQVYTAFVINEGDCLSSRSDARKRHNFSIRICTKRNFSCCGDMFAIDIDIFESTAYCDGDFRRTEG
jgi:hypothetical protein